jgi:hypothetical protein
VKKVIREEEVRSQAGAVGVVGGEEALGRRAMALKT